MARDAEPPGTLSAQPSPVGSIAIAMHHQLKNYANIAPLQLLTQEAFVQGHHTQEVSAPFPAPKSRQCRLFPGQRKGSKTV